MLACGMMKTILLLMWLAVSVAGAQTSKDLLRDGLFAEESEGDLKTATEKYEALLKSFEKERKVAAVALFRLAAVKRKQSDEKGALACYEEFSKKFSDIEPQATLVRENYLALSGKELLKPNAAPNEEDQEIARLKKLAVTSPDLFPNLDHFDDLVKDGWDRAVAYLLKNGADPNHQGALEDAAKTGNLSIVNLLLKAGADPNHEENNDALGHAVSNGHWQIAEVLAKHNATLSKSWPSALTEKETMDLPPERIAFIIAHGADPNHIKKLWNSDTKSATIGIPLHDAVRLGKHQFAQTLLKAGAKVDLARESDGIRALHLACKQSDEEMIKILIAAGTNLDTPTLGKEHFPERYAGMSGKAPIDLISIEKSPLLIDAGAKLQPRLLNRAISSKNLELVRYFLNKGADPNPQISQSPSTSPLDSALNSGDKEIIEHLLKNGAKLSMANWGFLTSEYRIQTARKNLYPDYSKSPMVTVVLPELNDQKSLTAQINPGDEAYSDLLKVRFPFGFIRNNQTYRINLDRFTWNLIRGGKVEKLDLLTSPLPIFRPGDIIELIGFGDYPSDAQLNKGHSLRSLEESSSKITFNLRKASRFPIKITYDGVTHDMIVCPDKLTFDARGNELPAANLGQTFLMIMTGSSYGKLRAPPHRINITRAQFPKFSFYSDQQAMNGFQFQRGDHLEIVAPGPAEPNPIAPDVLAANMQSTSEIIARLPGKLGEWRWPVFQIENGPQFGPSLLALIADLNVGYVKDGHTPEALAFQQLEQKVFRGILPGIDLERIVIHRKTKTRTEKILINLLEKIQQWEKSKQGSRPYDFQLQAGDIIDLSAHNGEWSGFDQTTNQYFEAVLNFPLIRVGTGTTEALTLNFKMPSWHLLNYGSVPIQNDESLSSIRGCYFQGSGFQLQRFDKDWNFPSSEYYWPQSGDVIKLIKRPPAPRKTQPTGSRVRYVPQSKRKKSTTPFLEWPLSKESK